jgi:hypothetical protein
MQPRYAYVFENISLTANFGEKFVRILPVRSMKVEQHGQVHGAGHGAVPGVVRVQAVPAGVGGGKLVRGSSSSSSALQTGKAGPGAGEPGNEAGAMIRSA